MECLRNKFQNGAVLDGRFETISPLNHGSFGMVFMARDLQTGDEVAIKCLTKRAAANEVGVELAFDDKSEEMFCHRVLGAHPNVVNLTHSFETDAHLYLVLEFCSRGDLYEAIRTGYGPLETEHVRCFMLELIDAVSYMHSKGIYHRDIKPENIFLTAAGSMKLGDFGLATTDKWSQEMAVGSDRYMAPEQYDSAGAGYSPAQADIWAIGICLLNILFSRNPFTKPTETDPLFLDFSRDKQSLFDVFPTMSQDTYEVIVQCMNLDPCKRSLVGAREAINRVISFTTIDEALDDFCAADHTTLATANREPLRTPSIQSPQLDQGAFPWTKALHATSHHRQLSAIPDDESYTEDLFPKSERTTSDWFSGSALTPSISSVLTSNLAVSMNSLSVSRPIDVPSRGPRPSAGAGSLPVNMGQNKASASAMSMVFGRQKDAVSKSWSDMIDDDLEEEEFNRTLNAIKEMNSRTWSQDSQDDVLTEMDPASMSQAPASDGEKLAASHMNESYPSDDEDLGAGVFAFEPPVARTPKQSIPRYSPPSKRSHNQDKWAALGQRRRAFGSPDSKPFDIPSKPRQHPFGFGPSNPIGIGILEPSNHLSHKINRDRSKSRECPWTKARDLNWRKEKRFVHGDVEWVGTFQEAH